MAAPAYTEDLTDIDLAESTTGYFAIGGGASGLGAGADFAMQGTNCVDKQITNADKGLGFDNGSGITLGTGAHVWVWSYMATPGVTDTRANRGLTIFVGTATNAYCQYHVEGNDTYGAAGRVGKCYPIDYTLRTANTGSHPYRTLTGSPGANPQVFGTSANTTASVKSANLGLDAQRYGTGAYITAGDSGNPATFAGFNTQNDSSTNRWGILTSVGGGYELQGRFVIGQNNAKTATLAYFDDSDRNIALVDTFHAASDFTQFIIDHASTTCIWTNINITALGTVNRGRVIVNSANPTFTVTGGTWTSIGIITLRSNSSLDGLTMRATDQITLNGADMDNCLIDQNRATSAVLAASLDTMTDNTFISDGTGHAIELNSIGGGTMTWANSDSGYAATDGSTGNETIYVNVGSGTLTINVSAGYSTPTIRTAGATVTVVAGAVTVQATAALKNGTPVENARVFLKASDGTGPFPFEDTVTITRSGTTATVAHTAHGMSTNDKITLVGITDKISDNGTVFQITVTGANAYTYTTTDSGSTSYTGTIKSTFVALNGLTNASGVLSTSRVYSSAQPIVGWTRKSSSSPYLQEGVLVGTISAATGFAGTAVMLSDE
jgi:hypothetical protein